MAEYAILIGLIAVVSITIIQTVGTDILAIFTSVDPASPPSLEVFTLRSKVRKDEEALAFAG